MLSLSIRQRSFLGMQKPYLKFEALFAAITFIYEEQGTPKAISVAAFDAQNRRARGGGQQGRSLLVGQGSYEANFTFLGFALVIQLEKMLRRKLSFRARNILSEPLKNYQTFDQPDGLIVGEKKPADGKQILALRNSQFPSLFRTRSARSHFEDVERGAAAALQYLSFDIPVFARAKGELKRT
jgi:hypothetical protein